MFANCDICKAYRPVDNYGCCDPCSKAEEKLLFLARDHIRCHRRVNIAALADALAIDQIRIFRWLDQGRLRIENPQEICPDCRQPIVDGVFCGCTKFVETIAADADVPRSHGTPRRVKQKWEDYWNYSSRIRRHRHRRIWLVA